MQNNCHTFCRIAMCTSKWRMLLQLPAPTRFYNFFQVNCYWNPQSIKSNVLQQIQDTSQAAAVDEREGLSEVCFQMFVLRLFKWWGHRAATSIKLKVWRRWWLQRASASLRGLAGETLTNVGEPFVEVHHHPNVVAMTLLLPLLLVLWLRRPSWMKMEGQLYLNPPSPCNCLHNLHKCLSHIEIAWLMKVGIWLTWIPFNLKSPIKFITIEASPSMSLTCQRQPRGSYDK